MLASHTLSKAAFLCSVLLEEYECWHLAFKVGMFGLELPRPPASCKALEVSRICLTFVLQNNSGDKQNLVRIVENIFLSISFNIC